MQNHGNVVKYAEICNMNCGTSSVCIIKRIRVECDFQYAAS